MLGLTGCMGVGQGGMEAVRARERARARARKCVYVRACTRRGRG